MGEKGSLPLLGLRGKERGHYYSPRRVMILKGAMVSGLGSQLFLCDPSERELGN